MLGQKRMAVKKIKTIYDLKQDKKGVINHYCKYCNKPNASYSDDYGRTWQCFTRSPFSKKTNNCK